MQFFLLDFALAFVVLLGYRALAAVMREPAPALSLAGRLYPQPARHSKTKRSGTRVERDPVLAECAPRDSACCQSGSDLMACGERPPLRLINFW